MQSNFLLQQTPDELPVSDVQTIVRNFFVYSVHQEVRDLVIQVPFNPTHVFILNETPAILYMQRGGNMIPTVYNADLIILANTYYNFKPEFGGYLYGVHLEYPPGYVSAFPYWQCQIMFLEGAMNMTLFPNPGSAYAINVLPDPSIVPVADFTFEVIDPYPVPIANYDFIDNSCVTPRTAESACGGISAGSFVDNGGKWGNASMVRSSSPGTVRCMGISASLTPCGGDVWLTVTEIRFRFKWTYGGGGNSLRVYNYVNEVLDYSNFYINTSLNDGNYHEIIVPVASVATPVTSVRFGIVSDGGGGTDQVQTFNIDQAYVFGTKTP